MSTRQEDARRVAVAKAIALDAGRPQLAMTVSPSPVAITLLELGSGKRGSIADLPGTKTEVQNIGALIVNQNMLGVTALLGADALEETVKAVKGLKVLHLATHGYFAEVQEANPDDQRGLSITTLHVAEGHAPGVLAESADPMRRSGVLLAGSAQTIDAGRSPLGVDDGILTAYESMGLDLHGCELVVLSACETGLGDIRSGEGVYGLQRAFQAAGTRYILMSLWKVDDDSTQYFMTSFYQAWLGGATIPVAYKTAQVRTREVFIQSGKWAAFVLVAR